MLPPKAAKTPEQQQLLRLFRRLSPAQRETVLSFAAFLADRDNAEMPGPRSQEKAPDESMPRPIPRPEKESVVAAIRRLSQTFPMLDKEALLHEAAGLMTAHMLQGRPAVDVIDELEVMFRRHYERLKSE